MPSNVNAKGVGSKLKLGANVMDSAMPGGFGNNAPTVPAPPVKGVEDSRPGKGEGGVGSVDSKPMKPGPGGSQDITMSPRQSGKVKV